MFLKTQRNEGRRTHEDHASKTVVVLGTSFRTSAVPVRETLSFSESEASELLQSARSSIRDTEAVILSTCNRSELYLAFPRQSDAVERWLEHMGAFRGTRELASAGYPHYQLEGADAARHLFRVSCGLDSAILGDLQILGQIRRAVALSTESGTLGKYLQRAFTMALDAGADARQQTAISSGAASIGSALASLLSERLSTETSCVPPKVLVIGAGNIASDVVRHITQRQLGKLTIVNRTDAHARALARDYGASTVRWSSLWKAIEEAGIVVTATASREPFLVSKRLDEIASRRQRQPLLVVDAGMPRNVEPTRSVEIIGIDAIRERRHQTLAEREAAVPNVEKIVGESVRLWQEWLDLQPLEESLKSLYLMANQASEDAVDELLALRERDPSQMKRIVLKTMKRVLHGHVRSLRDFVPTLVDLRPGRLRPSQGPMPKREPPP